MTTHDHDMNASPNVDPMEARLRAMLAERATDVETTPALFEDVRTRARRGVSLRRVGALVGAAAAITGAAVVLPSVLQTQNVAPILDEPATEQPTQAPTEQPTEQSGGVAVDPVDDVAVALATTDGLVVRGREVLLEQASILTLGGPGVMQGQVRTLVMVTEGDDGTIRVALADTSPDGDGVNDAIEATPNGLGAVMSPDGQAAAWIEGSNLHIWPIGSDAAGVRVLPIEGDGVPADLVLEQWFAYADAPLLLASVPGGGMWTIPMDESNVFNTAPVGDAFPSGLVADADDAVLLQDGSVLALLVSDGTQPARVRFGDGATIALPAPFADSPDIEMESGAGGGITLLDRAGSGTAALLVLRGEGADGLPTEATTRELGTRLSGAITMGIEDQPDTRAQDSATEDEDADAQSDGLGFETNAPLLGTDGVALIAYGPNGDTFRADVYPAAESEAVLGRLAVRPGSTLQDAVVALESFSEGETSVRFARMIDGEAAPVGDILVTDGPVTGLVWSPDGLAVAWTTGPEAAGVLHTARVTDDLATTLDDTADVTGPVVDWIWTDEIDGRLEGVLVTGTPAAAEMIEVQRFTNGELSVLPGGTETTLFHDMHLLPVTSEGPQVGLFLRDGALSFGWGGDGDTGGVLSKPTALADSDGSGVRLKVSGGQVLLLTESQSWQVLICEARCGTTSLPVATDWDVVD